MVGDIFLRFFGIASNNGLLPRVLLIISHLEAETREIHLHLIHGLALVQADLDATVSSADAAEVVLLHGSVDNVLAATHLFKHVCVAVARKVAHNEVHDLHGLLSFVVVTQRAFSRGEAVRGKHGLLDGLSLAALDLESLRNAVCGLLYWCYPLRTLLVTAIEHLAGQFLGVVAVVSGLISGLALFEFIVDFLID